MKTKPCEAKMFKSSPSSSRLPTQKCSSKINQKTKEKKVHLLIKLNKIYSVV